MNVNLIGKTAIAGGGSSGIGLACAKMLYQDGADILISAHEGVGQAMEAIRRTGQVAQPSTHGMHVKIFTEGDNTSLITLFL